MKSMWAKTVGKMKLSIRSKLLLGFLAVVALLAIVSLYALIQIQGMSSKSKEIDSAWMPSVTLLGIMNGDVSDVERLALSIIVEQDAAELEKMKGNLDQLLAKIETERGQLKTLVQANNEEGSEISLLLEEFNKNYDGYLDKMPEFVQQGLNNNLEESSRLHREAYPLWFTANDNITKMIVISNEGAGIASSSSLDLAEQSYITILTLTIIAAVIALLIAIGISIMISRPIQKVNQAAIRIAGGDLTGEPIVLLNKDELGTLAASFNTMSSNLRGMIESVGSTSELVAASSEELQASAEQNTKASEQISVTVDELETGTAEQLNIVKRSSQAMGEMAIGTEQIAELAQSVSVTAIDAANQSAEGNKIIQGAVEQMGSVRQSMISLSELMTVLGERSSEISAFTAVINNIAGQTNLLALNAAIEAARAGEHGRGFAVVAGEVRKLAEESSASAQQIASLVQMIQQDTRHAVKAVQVNSEETQSGMEIVTEAGRAFQKISNAINKVAGEIQEVSAGAEQMAASSDEVVKFMKEVSDIAEKASGGAQNVSAATEQQLASMEEIAASAASLSQMAEQLQGQVNKFKI